MIIFKGTRLKKSEQELITQFIDFVLGIYLSKKKQKRTRLTIRFMDPKKVTGTERAELREYKAWMVQSGKRAFVLTINSKMLYKSDNWIKRMKPALQCIGHELVHVKQYLNGEMRDYKNGDAWFKGQRYKDWEEDANYWFSPWEIEAYGLEQGLFVCFRKIIEESSNR